MNLRPASERNDGATLNLGAAGIAEDLHAVRQRAPLVHNITNFVVMQQTANALLALGASPIMAHAEAELDELLALAGALVLNIGTLDAHWISAMEHALAAARQRALPVVLDPATRRGPSRRATAAASWSAAWSTTASTPGGNCGCTTAWR